MLHEISNRIANRMVHKQMINPIQVAVYVYGLEIILSSLLGILAIALISAVASVPLFWIPYLLAFVPLRLTAGGCHARSHAGCILYFSSIFVLLLIASQFLLGLAWIPSLVALLSLTILFFISPVEIENKPLSKEQHKRNRKRSLKIGCLNFILSILAYIPVVQNSRLFLSYYMGMTAATVLLVAAFVINHTEGRK